MLNHILLTSASRNFVLPRAVHLTRGSGLTNQNVAFRTCELSHISAEPITLLWRVPSVSGSTSVRTRICKFENFLSSIYLSSTQKRHRSFGVVRALLPELGADLVKFPNNSNYAQVWTLEIFLNFDHNKPELTQAKSMALLTTLLVKAAS